MFEAPIQLLKALAAARLREAVRRAMWTLALAVVALTAVGLAVAAGVIGTAARIGVVPALLAWAGGLLTVVLIGLVAVRLGGPRRPAGERSATAGGGAGTPAGAPPFDDPAFRAGLAVRDAVSPLGACAAAFAVGMLIATTRRR